jgi:hypothetical protein
MPSKFRRPFTQLLVSGLAFFALAVVVRHFNVMLYPSRSTHSMALYVTTPTGVPLASVFEGEAGVKLDPTLINRLLSEAKAHPHVVCQKERRSASQKMLDLLGFSSVQAQSGCDSTCAGINNSTVPAGAPSCPSLTICWPVVSIGLGCEGNLQYCPGLVEACGQVACPNDNGGDGW